MCFVRRGQSSTTLRGVSLLSLLLCRGSQQISSPQVLSPTGNCLILPVPQRSLCLSGSAASTCLLWHSAATRSALRKAVTASVQGRRMEPAVPGRAQCTGQGWLFPCTSARLGTAKSSAEVSLGPRRKSEACFCTAIEEHYRFILFHTHSPLSSLPSNPS